MTTIETTAFHATLASVPSYPYGDRSTYALDFPGAPWRSEAWFWATNGHLIVGIKDGNLDGTADTAPSKLQTGRAKYFESEILNAVEVDLVRLKELAGIPFVPHTVECHMCLGSGWCDDETTICEHCGQVTRRQCDECQGKGTEAASLPERQMRVVGVPVNVAYLAFGLSVVPQQDGRVRVGHVSTKSGDTLMIEGDSWRIGLMQLNEVFCSGIAEWNPSERSA